MATPVKQGTLTINAAFLSEIKEVHQELWDLLADLRKRHERLGDAAETRQLIDDLAQLRDLLALHFSLEEAYGYFDDPVAVAPRLSEAAHQLRDEHIDLYVQSCQLVDMAESLWQDGRRSSLYLRVLDEFENFDHQLQRHEEDERALITSAYCDDIGVGD